MSVIPSPHGEVSGNPWRPLRPERIHAHFVRSRDYENIGEYMAFQEDLLPDERVILFFLHRLYAQSLPTIRLYTRYLVGLLNHARTSCERISSLDVDVYLRHLERTGMKPSSRNTVAATLRSFFRHLADSGLIRLNPTAFLKRRRTPGSASVLMGHLTHSLADEDLRRFLEGMERVGAPFRDVALFRLLYMTGLRAEEAVSLRWSALLLWQNKYYFNVIGKGSRARRVYVPLPVMRDLQTLRAQAAGPGAPVFASLRRPGQPISANGLYKLVKKWSVRVLERGDVSPHWFRHSCFTLLASRGVRLESIQALAGHASIETTMLYNEAAKLMEPAGTVFDAAEA